MLFKTWTEKSSYTFKVTDVIILNKIKIYKINIKLKSTK